MSIHSRMDKLWSIVEYHIAVSENTITRKKNIDKSHKYILVQMASATTYAYF